MKSVLRSLIVLIPCLFVTAPSSAYFPRSPGTVAQTIGGMVLNLATDQYFNGYNAYLNWYKTGSEEKLVSSTNGTLTGRAIWDNGTYLDANGELKNPVPADVISVSRGFFTPAPSATFQYEGTSFNNFAGQVWDVTWTGCANPNFAVTGSLGTGAPTPTFGSNSGTITLGSSGYSNVGLTYNPNASGCPNNPPNNIVVSQHQYATSVAAGKHFNPDWVTDVKSFSFLRLMDWMQTNGSGITDSSQLNNLANTYYNTSFGMAWADKTSSTISGTTLTTAGTNNAVWAVGDKIVCVGCTNSMTITAQLMGTPGGDGTYSLSCTPSCNAISGTQVMGIPPVGSNQSFGPKGGVGIDLACAVANEVGTGIEYPIPITASNQFVIDVATGLKACTTQVVKIPVGNEDWNPAFDQYYYGFALAASVGVANNMQYAGYRAAQILSIVQGIYGSNSGGGRWIGALGSQLANTSVSSDVITGALIAISANSLSPLPQLVSLVDTAAYIGDFESGFQITNITIGATPTITANSDNGSGVSLLHNGQVVKLFVSAADGTVSSVLSNVYATVSSVTTTSFAINISTSGLTYSNPGCPLSCANPDQVMDATLFKMADQSAALNTSTPATYPTKFSYFSQQISKAYLNGSASDAPYGTYTPEVSSTVSGAAGSIQSLFSQHSLIINENGLRQGQYEGGIGLSLSGFTLANPPSQLLEYFINWQFDAGVTGDATNTVGNLQTTSYNAFCSFNSNYSSYAAQYNDAQAQTQFGPWGALRWFGSPGDEGNPKWTAIVANNAKGLCVDPTPAAVWASSYPGDATNKFFSNSNCSPCTDTLPSAVTGTSAGELIVIGTIGGGSITSMTCDGVAASGAQSAGSDAFSNGSGRSAAIFHIPLAAGANTRSCSMVSSGSAFQNRTFYVTTVHGLASATPLSANLTNETGAFSLSYSKGALLVVAASCNGNFASTSGVSTPSVGLPTTTTVVSGIDNTNGTSEFGFFSAPFSNPNFLASPGCNDDTVGATYR